MKKLKVCAALVIGVVYGTLAVQAAMDLQSTAPPPNATEFITTLTSPIDISVSTNQSTTGSDAGLGVAAVGPGVAAIINFDTTAVPAGSTYTGLGVLTLHFYSEMTPGLYSFKLWGSKVGIAGNMSFSQFGTETDLGPAAGTIDDDKHTFTMPITLFAGQKLANGDVFNFDFRDTGLTGFIYSNSFDPGSEVIDNFGVIPVVPEASSGKMFGLLMVAWVVYAVAKKQGWRFRQRRV